MAVLGFVGAVTPARAEGPSEPCAHIAKLQAPWRGATTAPAPDPNADPQVVPGKVPALVLDEPLGQCWPIPGGGAWGLVVTDVVAGWSSYQSGAVELEGSVIAVHIDAQGIATQTKVGTFVQGPWCDMSVSASPVTPSQQALLVTVIPSCHEAAGQTYGVVVAWRQGALAATETSKAHGPLVFDDEVVERVWTWRYGKLRFPGGIGGTFSESIRIPFSIRPDGELAFDSAANAALEEGCADKAVGKLDYDGADALYSDDIVAAIACDWVRGADVKAALTRVLASCGKLPKSVTKLRGFDREDAIFEWATTKPAQCALVESAWALLKTTPPVRLGAGATAASGEAKALTIARVAVSNAVAAFKDYTFTGGNLIDGKLDTSWQPRTKRPHAGAWARLELGAPASVTAVVIANGFQREDALGDLFAMNDRVATGTLTFDDGPPVPFTLDAATRGRVTIPLPAPRITRQVSVTITSSHPGSRWGQVAISELELVGAPAD